MLKGIFLEFEKYTFCFSFCNKCQMNRLRPMPANASCLQTQLSTETGKRGIVSLLRQSVCHTIYLTLQNVGIFFLMNLTCDLKTAHQQALASFLLLQDNDRLAVSPSGCSFIFCVQTDMKIAFGRDYKRRGNVQKVIKSTQLQSIT